MNRIVTLAVASILTASSGIADGPANVSADTASKLIEACVSHAKGKHQSHAIAVVDGGGHLVAFLRMDGNASGIGEFALQKAEAAASWHFSTSQMEKSAKETPGFASAPHVVTVPGGFPIFTTEGRFIGAVGVSGEAPQDDAECGEAGLKAAGLLGAPPKSP